MRDGGRRLGWVRALGWGLVAGPFSNGDRSGLLMVVNSFSQPLLLRTRAIKTPFSHALDPPVFQPANKP